MKNRQHPSKNVCIRTKAKENKFQKISMSKIQKSPFLAQKRMKLAEFGNNSLNLQENEIMIKLK